MPGMPYLGWSLPQVVLMTGKATQFLNDERADQMTSLSMAAQSVVSKKAGTRLKQAVDILRKGRKKKKDRVSPKDSQRHDDDDEDGDPGA